MKINPRMLSWARETAGLSLAEAADKLGLKVSSRASATEKLGAIEAGERAPTDAQLRKAAGLYLRPLISFYLSEPPRRGDRGEDFRTVAGAGSPRENALLDALMRDVRARQQMLRELLLDREDAGSLPFVASAEIGQGATSIAASIRTALEIAAAHQKAAKGPAGLFASLRAAAERIGVYVLLLGDVGSYHSDIGEEVFRGFALADDVAPIVVINDNDAVTARSFTLLHELAHIWIGASGVSGPVRWLSESAVERFCNEVAGEFLLPGEALADIPSLTRADLAAVLGITEGIAETWNVSQGVVAYRLASSGRIKAEAASALFRMLAARWREQKQHSRAEGERGPSYYRVRRHRLGPALLAVVRRALQEEALTHTRAAKILGVSPSSVGPLLQEQTRAA